MSSTTEYDDTWTWRTRLWLRWFRLRCWLRHCPNCKRRGYYPDSPRWDEDKTARMLGLPIEGHCPNCGKRITEDGAE